jgi:hypothetical protein
VDERPPSETNYKEHSAPIDAQYQTYNLQAASVGDIDLTGETLVGHMGWAWAQRSGSLDVVRLVTNGVEVNRLAQLAVSPRFITQLATSTSYPSNARGIGMYVETEFASVTMFECGVVVAYEGPADNPDILLARTLVDNETLATIIDDLRADPPDSYEVCCIFEEFDGTVEIVIHSLDQDSGSVSYQGTLNSRGRTRITPGVEVYLDVTVTGVTMLTIWRRMNVD